MLIGYGSYCVFLYSARSAAVNWQMKLVRKSASVCVFPAHIYVLLSPGYFERNSSRSIWKILWKKWIFSNFFGATSDYEVFLNFCEVFCVQVMYKSGWAVGELTGWYPGSSLAATNVNVYVCLWQILLLESDFFVLFCHSCLLLSSFSELSVHLLCILLQQWFSLFDLLSMPTSVLPIDFCTAPGYTVVLGLLLANFLSPSPGIP